MSRLMKIAHFLLSFPLILRAVSFTIRVLGISKLISRTLAKIGFWNGMVAIEDQIPANYLADDDRVGPMIEWVKS